MDYKSRRRAFECRVCEAEDVGTKISTEVGSNKFGSLNKLAQKLDQMSKESKISGIDTHKNEKIGSKNGSKNGPKNRPKMDPKQVKKWHKIGSKFDAP